MGRKIEVIVDPKRQFGQPIVSGTRIKTETIYSLYKGGEKTKSICKLYDIPTKKVNDAIYFHSAA